MWGHLAELTFKRSHNTILFFTKGWAIYILNIYLWCVVPLIHSPKCAILGIHLDPSVCMFWP